MTTILTTKYPEEGTMKIVAAFTDEDGDVVVPNADTITYTLSTTPEFGTAPTIINSLEDQALSSASTVTFALTGDDLALLSTEDGQTEAARVLHLQWEYDSDLGSDLKGKAQLKFQIENYFNV